eukprot:SAG31_NODE_2666_length_5273_cov_2.404716_3_plen_170_part_00
MLHANCFECGAEGTPEELAAAAAEAAALAEQEAWANAPTVSRRPNLETVTASASAEATSLPVRTVAAAAAPPPLPRTGYELESGLKSMARLGDAATAGWLLAVPPAKLTAMLRSVLTAELILAMLRPLGSAVEANPDPEQIIGPVVGLLVALTKAERFDMTVRTFVDLG